MDQFWPESYYDIDLENISKESNSWTVRQFQTKIFLENSSQSQDFIKNPSLVNFSESCTQDRILENGSESFKPNRTVVFNPFIFTTLEVKSVGGVFKMFTRWMIQNRCLLPKLFWNSGFWVDGWSNKNIRNPFITSFETYLSNSKVKSRDNLFNYTPGGDFPVLSGHSNLTNTARGISSWTWSQIFFSYTCPQRIKGSLDKTVNQI